MIRFILGEDRHVKYFVHSVKSEYFVVKDATYELIYNGEVEASGSCELTQEEDGSFVDVKLQPKYRLMIADEVIKNREQMEVV